MLLTSVSFVVLTLTPFIKASPPSITPLGISFDKLRDSFIALENNRLDVIRKAVEVATNRRSNVTLKFLDVVGHADYALENIRRYFDAGKIKLDFERVESNLPMEDVIVKTHILEDGNYLNLQMQRLTAIIKYLETREGDLPADLLDMLRPIMDNIKQSEQTVAPLEKQLHIDTGEAKKRLHFL